MYQHSRKLSKLISRISPQTPILQQSKISDKRDLESWDTPQVDRAMIGLSCDIDSLIVLSFLDEAEAAPVEDKNRLNLELS